MFAGQHAQPAGLPGDLVLQCTAVGQGAAIDSLRATEQPPNPSLPQHQAGFVLISMASALRNNQATIAGVDRAACDINCQYKVAARGYEGVGVAASCRSRTLSVGQLRQSRMDACNRLSLGSCCGGHMRTGGVRPNVSLHARIPSTHPAPAQTATGMLSLADDARELYGTCASTTRRPDGSACSPGEMICYKCYCYEAIYAGNIKWGGALA